MTRRGDGSARLGLVGWVIRKGFDRSKSSAPPDHAAAEAKTRILEDLDYGSVLPDGRLDLMLPAAAAGPLPLVVLVHGGGFVGGLKAHNRIFAVELAARGFAVANIGYRRAPEAVYPAPLLQIGEAFRFLAARADPYGIDLESVFLAGDSAGAQMAAQFVLCQVDPAYAAQVGVPTSVPPACLRGVLLFCGLYDLGRLAASKPGPLLRLGFRAIGRLYFGRDDWERSPQAAEASLLDKLGPSYPPVFVTDGNSGSFEDQGRALARRLVALGVPVTPLFHDRTKGRLSHEYQYVLDTDAGAECFDAVVAFLSRQANFAHYRAL